MPCPIALLKPPYVVIFEIAKMKQIVMIGNHNSLNASTNKRPASPKLTFLAIKTVIIIVIRIAVPVWPIKFNDKVIGLCEILLNVPGKSKFATKADNLPFGANNALNEGALQIITMTVKIMNGLQANKTSLPLSFFGASGLTSFWTLKIFLGWNFLENKANANIEASDGMISANSGPLNTVSNPCKTV